AGGGTRRGAPRTVNEALAGSSEHLVEATTVAGPHARREPLYCWGLLAVAVVAGLSVVVAGATWPDVAPVVVLAALVLVSVNRGTLFPSEMSVTADAAMMLAAVTLFRGSSPVIGPFLVALLTGPPPPPPPTHLPFPPH